MNATARRVTLAAVLAALVPAFALTLIIVGRYKDERQRLAGEWSARGQVDVAAQPSIAVVDFETALAYGHDRESDRLRLAEALIAARRPAEAEAHLLTLRAEEPGRGEVALDLARLAAARNDLQRAVPYYHTAIDGAWDTDAAGARRRARLELSRLLLLDGQDTLAQAELIALIDDLPPDADLITDVGTLLAKAGADARATTLFQRALALNPTNATAARLAGQIAFRAGDYRDARQLLARSGAETPLDPASVDMLDVAGRVLARDPGAKGLAARERAARTYEDFGIARDRLARCQASASAGGGDGLADVAARAGAQAALREPALLRDPDLGDQVMSLVFDIVALPSSQCGVATPDERALELIAEERRATPR
jgi:tetratricopeptide (TPR) repeat protein